MSTRGAPPPIPPDVTKQLADTRAARELLVEQMQYSRLHRLKERQEATYDYLTPYIDLIDRARRDPAFAGPAGQWMRRYGRNYPIYQTEQELATYRAGARVLLATNSYAQGYQEGLTSYVIGPGLTYRATRKPDARLDEEALRPLVKACQAALDEFCKRVQWYGGEEPGLEEELFWRGCEDGEWFLAHFAVDDGLTDVRTVEPEQVTAPPGGDPMETSFGIITPRDDVQKKLGIYLYWGDNPAEGEEWDPAELLHFKRNAKRSMKRGMTDYCFDAYDAMQLAGRLTTNMADAAAQQAAIVGIREHESADADQIQQFVDAEAEFTQADGFNTGTQTPNRYYRRGHWEDIQKGLKYVPGPLATNSPIHIEVLQAVLRAAGRKWQSPEWLISGLHDTSSFASSLTSESPFTRQVIRGQRPIREVHTRTMLIVLRNKADAGRLVAAGRTWSWDEVCELVEVQAEAPSPAVRDRLQEAQTAAIEVPLGVDSRQRYVQGQGRDWHQVEQDNEEYQDAHPDQPPPGAGGDPPAKPPTPPRPSGADRTEAWSEEDHPRDDSGKFVSAEAMAEAKKDPAKAAELRREVTDPAERKKLDAAIGDGKGGAKGRKAGGGKKGLKAAEAKAKESQQKWYEARKRGDAAEEKQQLYASYFYNLAAKHYDDGEPQKAAAAWQLADDFATGKRKPAAKPADAGGVARESLTEAILESLLEDAGERFTGTKTDSLGREYHYVDGKRVASAADVEAAKAGKGAESASKVPADAPTDAHVWGDVHDALPADVRDKPTLMERARKLTTAAYHAAWTFLAEHGHGLSMEVLDTAQDYEKISFSKLGHEGQAQHDPFMVHLGVPYSAVAAVVSSAVGAAAGYLKRKARAESLLEAVTDENRQAVADGVAELYRGVFEAMGAADLAPAAADVLRFLAGAGG